MSVPPVAASAFTPDAVCVKALGTIAATTASASVVLFVFIANR